jgi:hypothetical protein
MTTNLGSKLRMIIAVTVLVLLTACGGTSETQDPDAENPAGEEVTLAMVDSVTVEQRGNHFYAIVTGNYPDPCTSISSVEQIVEGNTIGITLLTDRPADLMCAAVLTPFTIDVLLATGGLVPGEYSVMVNEGPSTTFVLE